MRHRTRHIHKTLVEHVRSVLNTTDWLDEPPTNFPGVNTEPVTLVDYEPQYLGEVPAYNTVAVSLGDQGSDDDYQLGDWSKVVRIPLFVDVYPINEAIGVAIADDLKVGLVDLVLPISDYSTSPATATQGIIEIEDVTVERLQSTLLDKRSWRCVKATLNVYPNGE